MCCELIERQLGRYVDKELSAAKVARKAVDEAVAGQKKLVDSAAVKVRQLKSQRELIPVDDKDGRKASDVISDKIRKAEGAYKAAYTELSHRHHRRHTSMPLRCSACDP